MFFNTSRYKKQYFERAITTEREIQKEAMKWSKVQKQNWSKEIKSDKFCYLNIGKTINKWRAIEKSPKIGAPMMFSPTLRHKS